MSHQQCRTNIESEQGRPERAGRRQSPIRDGNNAIVAAMGIANECAPRFRSSSNIIYLDDGRRVSIDPVNILPADYHSTRW
jgi:hypothetical protein